MQQSLAPLFGAKYDFFAVVETRKSENWYPQQKHHKRWALEMILISGKSRLFRSEKQYSSLKMKCPNCGCWNRVPVNKVFVERRTSETKVTTLTPMYRPLSLSVCRKCGKVLARPTELIAIRRHIK